MPTTANVLAMSFAGALLAGAAHAETIRLSTYVNETDIRHQGFIKFAELVTEKTEGRVTVEIFPSSTLHTWSDGVDALQGGVSDISWISADTRLPCYRVTSLYPAAINLTDQIGLDAAYAELIAPEAAAVGLIPILNSNYSYDQEWWFQGPIDGLNKLDGKLVRSIGPLVSLMIETWGGQPVFIAPGEVFQSAERGVVNGINMGVATYSSWQLWNVMPYMVNANLFYGNIQYMMNVDRFNALAEPDRAALLEAASETETWLQPRYESWINEQVGNAVMSGGGAAVSISTEERNALIAEIEPKWAAEVDAACGPDLAGKLRDLFAKHRL
ncbi:MAG: TRAP transporter substrate-binding protein DctP [Pseudotabrizicola sp.]|uniref:TRAP transporter substrate-binding protein DctP n=1 Tax=Pseudotabrizicola sp. TaxID=2939647 RepID=UPI0027319E05|nr:TRAP transporter substrate-binding protein DctP [Pseudotabrizicola sp.]MDP2083523.1 TRAP transporter substrate-binding protein DctP [Pseudotabrizicola sp.]MDZ7575042.1 TRAP transporter substrate-binding protein DctP [Pseudotabrizicola sp.]